MKYCSACVCYESSKCSQQDFLWRVHLRGGSWKKMYIWQLNASLLCSLRSKLRGYEYLVLFWRTASKKRLLHLLHRYEFSIKSQPQSMVNKTEFSTFEPFFRITKKLVVSINSSYIPIGTFCLLSLDLFSLAFEENSYYTLCSWVSLRCDPLMDPLRQEPGAHLAACYRGLVWPYNESKWARLIKANRLYSSFR